MILLSSINILFGSGIALAKVNATLVAAVTQVFVASSTTGFLSLVSYLVVASVASRFGYLTS